MMGSWRYYEFFFVKNFGWDFKCGCKINSYGNPDDFLVLYIERINKNLPRKIFEM